MAKYPMLVPLNEIKLADTVKLFDGPWCFAVVTQVTADEIIMTRPYGTTADFSYTGGVIFYTGQEICKRQFADTRFQTLEVWDRKDLK